MPKKSENDTSWMKEVNEILSSLRFRDGNVYVRFLATQFPKPTIAIAVYDDGEKIFERPIQRLAEFIDDLKDAYEVCKSVKTTTTRRTRRSRRRTREEQEEGETEEEEEEQENEEEEEEEQGKRSSRRRRSSRRSKKTPQRD